MEEYRKTMCVFFRNRVVTRCCLNNTKIDIRVLFLALSYVRLFFKYILTPMRKVSVIKIVESYSI